MKCPECGSENKDDAIFCKICGTSLKIKNKDENIVKFENESLKENNEEKIVNSETKPLKESSISNRSNEKSDKSGGSKNTLIICATAIICVLIVAGAFLILNTDLLSNSNNEVSDNITDANQTNVSQSSDSSSSSNEMSFAEAKSYLSGASNTVIRNTFDEADADGDGVLVGKEISKFKSLADLTDRTADTSNTEHVEATDQGAGDGTTKTRYCTTHGRVAVGDDNLCPYCKEEGLDARTVKDSTEYI